jgi:hypothetical protein
MFGKKIALEAQVIFTYREENSRPDLVNYEGQIATVVELPLETPRGLPEGPCVIRFSDGFETLAFSNEIKSIT